MKKIVLLLLALGYLSFACTRPDARLEGSLEPGQVWAHMDSEWRSAPPEAEVREATAWAKLATFRPGGEFIWLSCILIKQSGIVRVSQGDPVVVYRGHWRAAESGAHVEYRPVFRTIKIAGQTLPGALERSIVKQSGHSLTFRGQEFNLLKGLDLSSFVAVSKGL
jgi:hypothetical protein